MKWLRDGVLFFVASLLATGSMGCPVFAQSSLANQEITITADGQSLRSGSDESVGTWDILPDRSVFRFKPVEESGEFFDKLQVIVHLPESVTADQVKPNIFAVHGAGDSQVTPIDSSKLLFTVDAVGPSSVITITVDFPPEAITFSSWQRLIAMGERLSMQQWLMLAFIMPVLIAIYAGYVLLSRWGDIFLRPAPIVQATPPSPLPPAYVGVLVNGYVGVREIAATFIDLAQRGYIDIIYRGENDFGFSQKRDWQRDPTLQEFELFMLAQVFPDGGVVSSNKQINQSLNAHIWSETVSQAVSSIYTRMEQLGYFTANPRHLHMVLRFIGITMFFLSALGLAASFLLFSDQLYVVIPWVVSLVVSPFLNRIALWVPPRTVAGRQQAAVWLAFRQWLLQAQPARYVEEIEFYERYLALSIVLGVESQWTARYTTLAVRLPKWFFTQSFAIGTYEQLADALFGIIGFVSHRFSFSRKPNTV